MSQMRKNSETSFSALPRYCGESNGSFETLLKFVYGNLDDNCSNIAA